MLILRFQLNSSISQVYGVIIEYLDQLPEEERKCLKDLIYDDNCHMAKFASKNAKVNPNELTNFLNLGQNPLRQNPLGQNPLGHNPRWTKSPRTKSPRTKSP